MQKYIEEHMSFLCRLQMENILEHRKMTGAGDRQKFRHALNETQEHRVKDRHEVSPFS